MTTARQTYRKRTFDLETVKFALGHGYSDCAGNLFAIRHFNFVRTGSGSESPAVEVRWFRGNDYPSISIGNTHYSGDTSDRYALEQLKKFW
jgi:hypothetical protein